MIFLWIILRWVPCSFPIQDLLAKWWSPTLTAIVVFTYLEIVTQRIGLKSTCDSKNLENTCNPSVSFKDIFVASFTDPHHSPPGKHLPYYQGDIRLTKKQQENLKKYGDPSKSSADSRAASSVDSERWPNAIIPYTFDCSIGKLIWPLGNDKTYWNWAHRLMGVKAQIWGSSFYLQYVSILGNP